MEYYVYTCQLCGELLRTFRNSESVECVNYISVPADEDDPLQEAREMLNELDS